jgi:hypothetical protein
MAGRQRGVQRGRRECTRTGRSEQGRRFLGRTSLALRAGNEVPRDLDRAGSRHAAGPHMAWRETVLPQTTAANKQFARVCVAATSGSGELVPPWPLQTCSGASCCALLLPPEQPTYTYLVFLSQTESHLARPPPCDHATNLRREPNPNPSACDPCCRRWFGWAGGRSSPSRMGLDSFFISSEG